LADGLKAPDALALLGEFAPQAQDPAASKALLVRGGQLALLLGDFSRAAELFESAAFRVAAARDDGLILQSARCRLAAGDAEKAADRAALVERGAASPALVLQARVVRAWALLIGGDNDGAARSARSLLPTAEGGDATANGARRELRFILWAATPLASRPAEAAALAKEFPASVEAAIANGTAGAGGALRVELFPLPHWYLSGLLAPTGRAGPAAGSATTPAQVQGGGTDKAQPAAAATGPAPAAARRYQLGIFSDQKNAAALVGELVRKGFAARTETRLVNGKSLFAVVVDGEADSLLLRLKDAGYEAWPLF
jgi:hypothetical protein